MTSKNQKGATITDDTGNTLNLEGAAPEAETPFTAHEGGALGKALNMVAHAALNRYLAAARDEVLRVFGHSQGDAADPGADEGDETSKTDAVTDMREPGTLDGKKVGTTVDIFAAPPFNGGRSAKAVATFAVVPPTQDVAVQKRGRHTYKKAKAKAVDKTPLPVTGDGSWRVLVNPQKYASEADRANGATTKARGPVEVFGDILKALLHIRRGSLGRSAGWAKDMGALGFVRTSTGKRSKMTKKPIYSWAVTAMSPSLTDRITRITDGLPAIPENLFVDYLAFMTDPSAPKTGGFAVFACPKVDVATSDEAKTEDNPEGKVEVPCQSGKVRLGHDVKAKMDADGKTLPCPWHSVAMVYQLSPAEVAAQETTTRLAAKRQRGA